MKIAKVRELLHSEPFRPFWIYLADGGRLAVRDEDFVALQPSGRELILYMPDDSHQILDVLMITRLEVMLRNGARQRKKR